MLDCKYREGFFDSGTLQNFIACRNKESAFCHSLVNSFVCQSCPLCDLVDVKRSPEIDPPRREPKQVAEIFASYCNQCIRFNDKTHTCFFQRWSKTIEEDISDARFQCKMKVWS